MPNTRTRYRSNPDGVVDLDYGRTPEPSTKVAGVLSPEFASERDETRQGYRELDAMLASSQMGVRSQDRHRATPRETTAPLGHPRKARVLQDLSVTREPLSSRQRKARSVTKHTAQSQFSGAVYDSVHQLVSGRSWQGVNQALSEAVGDAQELTDSRRREVQRLDRAIQAYERSNDRSHVVYVNVQLPGYVNSGNAEGYLGNHLPEGSEHTFDRYTMGAHCPHEIEPPPGGRGSVVVEISTRRGAYLGRSDSLDDTAHLLPRGLNLTVVGHGQLTYTRPDGSTGTRPVLQMKEITP